MVDDDFEVELFEIDLELKQIEKIIAEVREGERCHVEEECVLQDHVVIEDIVDQELDESRVVLYWLHYVRYLKRCHRLASKVRQVVYAV